MSLRAIGEKRSADLLVENPFDAEEFIVRRQTLDWQD